MARRKDDLAAKLKKAEAKILKLEKKNHDLNEKHDDLKEKHDDLKKLRSEEMRMVSYCLKAARGGADINITNMIDDITQDETKLKAMTGVTCK